MSLAFVAAAPEGVMALFQVFVLTCGLALLAGYPAVRFFDSAPAS